MVPRRFSRFLLQQMKSPKATAVRHVKGNSTPLYLVCTCSYTKRLSRTLTCCLSRVRYFFSMPRTRRSTIYFQQASVRCRVFMRLPVTYYLRSQSILPASSNYWFYRWSIGMVTRIVNLTIPYGLFRRDYSLRHKTLAL